MPKRSLSRRTFLATAASSLAGVAASRLAPVRIASANEKVNIAGIGLAGMGKNDIENAAHLGHNIVALCDVDWKLVGKVLDTYPDAKRYKDYREMLETQKDIDAVMIATPDHHHAHATLAALDLGKHVYCEKPLTHSVWEARQVGDAARKSPLATQMGNRGQADDSVRDQAEALRAGVIGPVREVHVWTDRPIWPQGLERPEKIHEVHPELDWDLWLGPAPERPYNRIYHPFRWRGWRDFGTGALGDIGCHAFHPIFVALKLGHPTTVEATSSKFFDDTYPIASIVRYEFPARGDMPPVALTWYDGGLKPPRPDELPEGEELGDGRSMYVGDEGIMLNGRILPEARARDFSPPEPTLARSPGHVEEWFRAIEGGPPAGANFDFASLVTEVVLLGNIALKTAGKLRWDPKAFAFTNSDQANQLLQREYRPGWTL